MYRPPTLRRVVPLAAPERVGMTAYARRSLAADRFRERGRAVTPGVDREHLPTPPRPC